MSETANSVQHSGDEEEEEEEEESSGTRYIRLRGLPWAVTNKEILSFLKGVNVVNGEKGIHLVTNRWDGKNTGEAFVELESENDEEEAFKHNKESLGHRYIEIFSASNEEAEHAMKKPSGQSSNVLKLRGLPYAVNDEMIEEFFDGLEIKPDREGILIDMDRRGRATGEAYVQFETQDDTEKALKLNREKIGHRYIEIFRSSISEMRRAANGGSRPGPYDKRDRGGGFRSDSGNDFGGRGNIRSRPREIWASGGSNFGNNGGGNFGGGSGGGGGLFGGGGFNNGGNNMGGGGGGFNDGGFNGGGRFNNNGGGGGGFGGNNGGGGGGGFGNFNSFGNNRNSNFGDDDFGGGGGGGFSMNRNNNMGGGGGNNGGGSSFGNGGFFGGNNNGGGGMNNFGPIGGGRNDDNLYCIHMRGLPYYCYESDVNQFFEPLCPVNVKVIYNKKGLHSGSADAYFDSHLEATQAMKKHREQMGSRYIELFYDGKTKSDGGFRRL